MACRTRYVLYGVLGAAWAALAVGCGGLLIRNLGVLAQWVGNQAALDADVLAQAKQILSQLQNAKIAAPWMESVAAGVLMGLLAARVFVRRKWLSVLMAIVLFVPAVLLALWCTPVNDIRVGALVRCLIPIIVNLL